MTEKERFLKEMSLDGDPVVKSHVHIWYDVWQRYGDRLNWLEKFSPHVSVGIARKSDRPAGSEKTDIWGCRWVYPLEAHDGQVVEHPVATWAALRAYHPPDPEKHTNWAETRANFAKARSEGRVARAYTDHGFIFLRLTYLRGYENLMLDVAEESPELLELIGIVEGYWLEVCRRYAEAGADIITFGDDLGLQRSLPISPAKWRRLIKPSYQRILSFCRSQGVHTFLHTDGYIVDIISDLIECGVSQLNPQDLVNGLDNLERLAKGKVAIHLDIDRQRLTVFGQPAQIRAHIRDCITKLGASRGGLSMIWYVFPPTPIENIESGARAMDEFASHWQPG
jgi:uroporphyrinogen-III decarboxylase